MLRSFTPDSSRLPLAVTLLGALLLAALAYAPGLPGPFLLDDVPNILQNPLLRIDGLWLDDWRTAAMSGASGPFGRPVAMVTFALDHALGGGFDATAMKLINTCLHLLTACLVFIFLRQVLSSPAFAAVPAEGHRTLAGLAALLWLLHPLHASTVLYVVQRMTQLSTLFTLAGLVVYLRYRLWWQAEAASRAEVIRLASWLVLFLLLAVLSKENGVLLLPLVLLCELLLFPGLGARLGRVVRRPLAWLLAGAVALSLVALLQDQVSGAMAGYRGRDFTPLERLLTQGRVLWHYVSWLVLPLPDSFALYHDDIAVSRGLLAPFTTLPALAGWIGIVALTLAWRRQLPVLAFGLGFFLVAHALESTILPLEIAYEHRNYLPSVGLLLIVAWCLVALADRVRLHGSVLPGIVVILLAALLVWRAYDWRDEYALMLRQAESHPDSARSQIAMAQVLLGKLDESVSMGLPDVSAAIAVQARERLQRARELAPGGLAAPVLMLTLQSRWRDTGMDSSDFLESIAVGISSGAREATDSAALGRLIQCASASPEICHPPAVEVIIAQTLEADGGFPQARRLRYEWSLATQVPAAHRRALLQEVLAASPRSIWANTYATREAIASGDSSAMYESVMRWYASDPARRRIPLIAGVFEAAP